MMPEFTVRLFLHDCAKLVQERRIEAGSLDFIYIDPPFNSKRNYSITSIGAEEQKEIRRFTDIWQGGYRTYITYMKQRVLLLRTLLKNTGVFVYHCDDTEAAHVETLILDEVFGSPGNKINNIYWQRSTGSKVGGRFGRAADVLLVYSPSSKDFTFNPQYGELTQKKLKYYTQQDKRDRFYPRDITAADHRPGSSGLVFTVMGREWKCPSHRHLAIPRTYLEKLDIALPKVASAEDAQRALNTLADADILTFGDTGGLNYKDYMFTAAGGAIQNIWTDITGLKGGDDEWINYPTQKPLALLERIIKAFTNEGDLVGDFFLGSGTTAVAALRLGRRFIGSDISPTAISLSRDRILHDPKLQPSLFDAAPTISVNMIGFPRTVEEIQAMDAKNEFADFIIYEFGGTPNPSKTGDMGIDGWDAAMNPIQVKRSHAIGRNVVDNFRAAIEREGKKVGTIIAWDFGRGAIKETARLEQDEGIAIALMPIDKIVAVNQSPIVSLEAHPVYGPPPLKVLFKAHGTDPDGEVINYAWAFDSMGAFIPDVPRDPEGVAVHEYATEGEHIAVVEVTDNQGAQARASIVITVQTNGV